MYSRSGDVNAGGGLAGGVCFGSQGVETYLHGGVPSSRLLVVDKVTVTPNLCVRADWENKIICVLVRVAELCKPF